MSEITVKNTGLIEQIMVLKQIKIQLKVRPNPGASTHNLMNYVKPAMRRKPKAHVIDAGTNDIQQEINKMKMVKKLVKIIKEIDSEKEAEIIFSGLIQSLIRS